MRWQLQWRAAGKLRAAVEGSRDGGELQWRAAEMVENCGGGESSVGGRCGEGQHIEELRRTKKTGGCNW